MMRTLRAPCPAVTVAAAFVMSLATVAAAQEAAPEAKVSTSPSPASSPAARRGVRPGDVQKVFVLKHARGSDMARLLSVFPAEFSRMERGNTHVLSVSAAPAVVAAIEETIKRLDVPPPPVKSVEVTAYVLECSPAGEATGMPEDLQDVLVQLRRTFRYSGCTLARTLFTRAADGSQLHSEFQERGAGRYSLIAGVVVDSTESTTIIRLRRLNLQNISPTQGGQLTGDIDIRDGQKVVLGRLGTVESGKDQIVVLTARVAP